jgi:two-component system cell cycle response regulator DivK
MNPKKLILIADDSYAITNILKRVFTLKHFDVITVKDGQQLLEVIESKEVDVVLLDINMPKVNGMECALKIRSMKDPKKASVPIISITGNYGNHTGEDFKAAGIDQYMLKPLDYDQLVNLVNEYLKN